MFESRLAVSVNPEVVCASDKDSPCKLLLKKSATVIGENIMITNLCVLN